MILYWIDKDLFVNWEASEDAKLFLVPHKGLPTAFSQLYNIMAMLWGNFTFLIDEERLSISFTHMMQMFAFSVFQLVVSSVVEPIMSIWGGFSLIAIGTILFYEYYVLDISFD